MSIIKNGRNNPWNKIDANAYDAHMGHANVAQLQMQKKILREQFEIISDSKKSTAIVAILGITNGNGLECVNELNIGTVIGIDISENFLDECKRRYHYLGSTLKLERIDLVNERSRASIILNDTDLIIANIVIEHIHLDNFIRLIKSLKKFNRIISCVIQYNSDGNVVSSSGYESTFNEILPTVQEIGKDDIIEQMKTIGYLLQYSKDYILQNGKIFIRLDFINNHRL